MAAALAEAETFQKALSLTAYLWSADPSRFPGLWERAGDDAEAQEIIISVWQSRDLQGLARFLPRLPLDRVLVVVQRAGQSLPQSLRDAVAALPIDRAPWNKQSDFLRKLSVLDRALAEAIAREAGPKNATEIQFHDASCGAEQAAQKRSPRRP